ncbi:MAG: cryptochrome/photolyase family protein [Planctomycetota bacterium]|nr:cryptochrome/photolyase family protein [Planctomycetota bacterium]
MSPRRRASPTRPGAAGAGAGPGPGAANAGPGGAHASARGLRKLVVVLGDQLSHDSPALAELDPDRDVVLMTEVDQESTHVPSHKQRTTLFLSAMRHFAAELRARGVQLRYVTLDDPANTHTFTGEVERAVRDLTREGRGVELVQLLEPGEYRVQAEVDAWEARLGMPVRVLSDPHFLTSREEFAGWAAGKQAFVMETFYRWQRKRLKVLVDEAGVPEGGTWNLDEENRKSFGAKGPSPLPPKPVAFPPDEITREVMEVVQRRFAKNPGSLEGFRWPVTRADALRALKDFVERRLPLFGPYEDAMWQGEPWLYHSLLSSSLNLKLLDPRECVAAAVKAYRTGRAPLQSVEGFVRQIIGWREFIRGVYWREGAEYASRNGLNQNEPLPWLYWSGRTDMNCMRQCVGEVLSHSFGHHIQRLMVTGNFALLLGVHPKAVSDWYLAMYVDAVEWATLPNTLGMSQHADARRPGGPGVVGTKPYVASGQYVNRMSNYCRGCRYDPGKRVGDDACPFTTLYWDFLHRHRATLEKNQRMTMSLKNLDRLAAQELVQVSVRARSLRETLGKTSRDPLASETGEVEAERAGTRDAQVGPAPGSGAKPTRPGKTPRRGRESDGGGEETIFGAQS